MTHSPLLIGFASILPGLGFWLLGQRRRSIIIGLVVCVPLYVSILFFGKPVGQFSAQVFLLAWLAQLIFAVQIAWSNQRRGRGEIQAPKSAEFHKTAKKLSTTQASDYYSREIAKGQLQNGERIIKSFIGKAHVSASAIALAGVIPVLASRWYCIALTQSNLMVIELDFLMKPTGVQRFFYSEVMAHFTKNWLNRGKLRLDFGQGKALELYVPGVFSRQAQAIAAVLVKPQNPASLGSG